MGGVCEDEKWDIVDGVLCQDAKLVDCLIGAKWVSIGFILFGRYLRMSISWDEIRARLSEKDYSEFCAWMRGQTVPSLDTVFEHDFDRWLVKKKVGFEVMD